MKHLFETNQLSLQANAYAQCNPNPDLLLVNVPVNVARSIQ